MGLAAFNRMRREQAEREAKAKQEDDQEVVEQAEQPEQVVDTPKSPNDDLTIPQIKEKLEASNIEFNAKAKKDELLVLLDEAEAKQEKPQDDSEEDQQPE